MNSDSLVDGFVFVASATLESISVQVMSRSHFSGTLTDVEIEQLSWNPSNRTRLTVHLSQNTAVKVTVKIAATYTCTPH